MSFEYQITLLPCHSLDDFPIYAIGEEADGLLTAWTTPWHPALVAMTGRMPEWCRIDDLPEDTHDALLFLPGGKDLDYGLPEVVSRVVADANCSLIQDQSHRAPCLEAAFKVAEIEADSFADRADLARDFMALGYWFLQVQLLTRHMRYSTSLDDQQFSTALVTAARHWQANEIAEATDQLSNCYNTLAQERDHYYPVDAYLIDLTLIAETTTARQVLDELRPECPVNLWMTAETLKRLHRESPEVSDSIRKAMEKNQASIYGGETTELPLPMLSMEHVLDHLKSANVSFYETLGTIPQHFGRRRFGITPRLPQILDRLGYRGIVHPTLDEGRFPEGGQTRSRWAGMDGTTIETIAGIPRDAALPETFLRLAMRMGESMESDYVATLCLAHWAGHVSPWYDDLRCGTRYGIALGRFATLDAYFEETAYTGQLDEFKHDQYRSPYLNQAVKNGESSPVSRWGLYWRHQAAVQANKAVTAWIAMLDPAAQTFPSEFQTGNHLWPDEAGPSADQLQDRHAELLASAGELASLVAPSKADANSNSVGTPGKILINPTNAAARTRIPLECQVAKPIYACEKSNGVAQSLMDTPAMGFSWATPSQRTSYTDRTSKDAADIASLSEPNDESPQRFVLRNEFCEVRVDPRTGGIAGLYDFHTRGNRLSQKLAMRQGAGATSTMRAEACSISMNSPLLGEVTAHGRLFDDKNPIAKFRQTTRLQRGSRFVELEIELDSMVALRDDPWNSYFANRVAWANEGAILHRDVSQSRQPTNAQRIESPLFVEIDDTKQKTAILTGGLPYHRRIDRRQLDTILVTQGEQQTKFSLALGVDCRSVVADAWNFLLPRLIVDHQFPPGVGNAWLFHFNKRNIFATDWVPRFETVEVGDEATGEDPILPTSRSPSGIETGASRRTCVGFTVRLLETQGKDSNVSLASFRPIKAARTQDFLGEENVECKVTDGCAHIKISANEWTQVEVDW